MTNQDIHAGLQWLLLTKYGHKTSRWAGSLGTVTVDGNRTMYHPEHLSFTFHCGCGREMREAYSSFQVREVTVEDVEYMARNIAMFLTEHERDERERDLRFADPTTLPSKR